MSMETLNWLNTMTLIGFTEKRGNAWHYKAEEQGDESNHYVGAIPLEDVQRRLFNWQAMEGTVESSIITPDGVMHLTDAERKTIVRPEGAFGPDDLGGILGIFKSGYLIHQYDEWLTEQVKHILDDDLNIGSAGLLKMGGVGWVSVEVPDSIITPSGVEFRPNLLAATSLDGSMSTTYKRVVTNVVCDNTMAAGLFEKGQQFKIRHSRYSNSKLADVRAALEIVHSISADFEAEVEQLTNMTVTDGQWEQFLNSLVPLKEANGEEKKGRGLTMATNKREKLDELWLKDERVAPWANTAWGVVQAVNTFTHHVQGASKTNAKRSEDNMLRAVTGGVDKLDRETMELLVPILA